MERYELDTELVDVAIPPLETPYSYIVPAELKHNVAVGTRVEVPLGRRRTTGYVVSRCTIKDALERISARGETKIPDFKSIHNSPADSCFTDEHLEFFQWVADYYQAPLASVIDSAVPAGAPPQKRKTVLLKEAADTGSLSGTRQKEIVNFLSERGGREDYTILTRHFSGCYSSLKGLVAKGIIDVREVLMEEEAVLKRTAPDWALTEVSLTADQEQASCKIKEKIKAEEFHTFLLHGVTGSGKTEVYIEVINEALRQGKTALVVVPEIALTPQLVDRFVARLGNTVAVLHSAMNRRERWQSWLLLREGKRQVAIGARSAVFAPIMNPGVIIVDEEHDGSFKQSDGLRYNGRDCAIVRARLAKCPVVLGSATPSLESVYNARSNKYTLLSLSERHAVHEKLQIEVVDLNSKKPWEMKSRSISPELHRAIEDTLQDKGQIFILFNRRGFASFFQCERCEEVMKCPNCDVSFTYHQSNNSLCCHYCSLSITPPNYCPACAPENPDNPAILVKRGAGTEKIEEELEELFPEAVIDRLDRDTASKIEDYKQILSRLRSREIDILVGTQMLAKGHDLPDVTLVGIADCDVGLHMPDFRAGERVFQLLTQAGGRAGRGEKKGRVLLQTRVPQHPSVQKTLTQDFEGFATEELETRRLFSYPPFSRLLRILVTSTDEKLPLQVLNHFRDTLDKAIEEKQLAVQVLGPVAAPFHRLRARWRCHMLVKSARVSDLHRIMHLARLAMKPQKEKFRLILDLDPADLL